MINEVTYGPKPGKPMRIHHLKEFKNARVPLTMLTAYDSITAQIIDQAQIDMILVGDSYGTTQLGFSSTTSVTLDDMIRATGAVSRVTRRALVIADLPFGTYEESAAQAVRSSVALVRAGAGAVKLEGGKRILPQVNAILNAGINVIGHVGFTPQSENALGGKRIQGRGDAARKLLEDALALEESGVSAIVLEMIPDRTTKLLHHELSVPLIGIGAGPHCDGQVLVWSDMAGMSQWVPSFVQRFGQVGQALSEAVTSYRQAVLDRSYPSTEHYHKE